MDLSYGDNAKALNKGIDTSTMVWLQSSREELSVVEIREQLHWLVITLAVVHEMRRKKRVPCPVHERRRQMKSILNRQSYITTKLRTALLSSREWEKRKDRLLVA